MSDVIIAEAVRSAVGRAHKGSLAQTRPDELAGQVIKKLMARVPQVPASDVEDIVVGCAMPEGPQGSNVARLAGFLGGLPQEASAMTVNRFCSSGVQAIAIAAGAVSFGQHEVLIAGGVESMSAVPMTGFAPSASPALMEQLPAAYTPMGITAENVAKRFGISRADQDAFALASQEKAAAAQKAGRFVDEIVPVDAVGYGGGERVTTPFAVDEMIRSGTTLAGLAELKPVFAVNGSVTAGNSSPLSDGAAMTLVLSKRRADAYGIRGLGRFRAFAAAGVDPAIMGIGPVPAVKKLLAKTGLTLADIDLVELNEAFASQAVYVQRQLEIPDAKLNVNGGAIALGHPLGCTGAKLTATALYELRRRGGRYAIVTMCIGGGQGAAALLESIA
jgi:acetyl-CoA acyltransferase